jgi:histidinol-phosphate aminotransferase
MFKESVKSMEGYSAPTEGRGTFSRHDFNECMIDPSPKVKEAIHNFVDSGKINMYPEGYRELNKKIGKYLGISPECIRITDGADGAIELISFSLIEPGAKVIIPSPSFGMFYIPPTVCSAKIVRPLYSSSKFEFDVDSVLKEIDEDTALIILCNPNNPTGTPIKKSDIEKILQKGKPVMVDEVYGEFAKESCIDLIDKYDNLFIIKSFSKAWALASLRIGYVISKKENILELNKVAAPYNVNQIGVVAATAALDDIGYMKKYVDEVMNKSKPLLEKFLLEKKIKFVPSVANFILIDIGDAKKVYESLKKKGILVRPQSSLPSMIRVSFGTLKDTEKLIDAINQLV